MQILDFEQLSGPQSTAPSCAGGCDFAADPSQRANDAPVFWLPEWRASAVILVTSPSSISSLIFTPTAWPGLRARRSAPDGEHFIFGVGREEHQLWFPDPPSEGYRIAAVIPFDDALPRRADASIRFARLLQGRHSPAPIVPDRRMTNTFRALDARLSGASYREIASCIFGPDRIDDEPWKSSSIRDATIRLVRRGVAMMQGGYRKFLTK